MLGKSVSTPSIVVHIADDNPDANGAAVAGLGGGNGHVDGGGGSAKMKIKQTRCPERQSSLD